MDANELRECAVRCLGAVAAELGLEAPEFDANGGFVFHVPGGRLFALYDETERLGAAVLQTAIGVLPSSGPEREELLLAMMDGNDMWALTEGGVLGTDPASGVVTLSYRLEMDERVHEKIVPIIESLMGCSDYWTDRTVDFGGFALYGERNKAPLPATGPIASNLLFG